MKLPGALPWVRIPASVVSKTVHLAGVGPRSIAYDTRAQSVSVFVVLTERFQRALLHAANAHACHLRKGTKIPYLSHLLAVASLVLENGEYGGRSHRRPPPRCG